MRARLSPAGETRRARLPSNALKTESVSLKKPINHGERAMSKACVLVAMLAAVVTVLAADAPAAQKLAKTTVNVESTTVTTSDGVRLFVETAGQGTPCLYIHGGPGSGSYWMRKFSDGLLERHFRMIYLDQRGTARSASPSDGNYTMDRMALDFEEVRKALGIQDWLTLGHSLGGVMQMGYYERYPRSIKGMLFTNCTLSLEDSLRNSWIPKAVELLGTGEVLPSADESVSALLQRVTSLGAQLQEKELMWRMAYASQENERLMGATFGDIPGWNHDLEEAALAVPDYQKDFRPLAPDVKVPVLFFYGKTDWMAGPEHYKGVHFPDMIVRCCDGGHVPIIENRKELEAAIADYQAKYGL